MKIRIITLFVLLISLALASSVLKAQARELDVSQPIVAAGVQRISTVEVRPYLPFQSSLAHVQEAYSGAMGTSFAYDVGYFGVDHISNLNYSANAGVTCQHNANLLVTCTGPLNQVTIDFDFTYVANDYVGQMVWWGYKGNSNYALDYTFNLIYPAPLVYVQSYSLEPSSITPTQITWYQANTRSLPGIALFRDPRVQVVHLPLVLGAADPQ